MNSATNGYKGQTMYLIKCDKCNTHKPQYHFKNPTVRKEQFFSAQMKVSTYGTGWGICKPCEAKK